MDMGPSVGWTDRHGADPGWTDGHGASNKTARWTWGQDKDGQMDTRSSNGMDRQTRGQDKDGQMDTMLSIGWMDSRTDR